MDDQKLRELLDRAGRAYNEGRYAEAIADWQKVLTLDPGNQKAREGIRMAQLLVVNWEAQGGEAGEGELSLAGGPDAETQEKIEFGIGRVRELMAAGRHQEALEGCQLLAELAPGMESIRLLLEEVTQASEAQPFIKERLDRAKKSLAQGKAKEAAEEARNILSVDRSNQEAQAILNRATGTKPAEERPKAPSAFQVEKTGKTVPPSPFSGRSEADALLAHFDFETEQAVPPPPTAQPSPPPAAAPSAAPKPEEPFVLEAEPRERAGIGPQPPLGPEAESKVKSLLDEGKRLLSQKQYQAAIDTWSRVFAVDKANVVAGELIDQAKGLLEDLARQAEEAFYRGVDYFDAGLMDEAKRAFEEVLSVHKDHAEARQYLRQIADRKVSDKAAWAQAPPKGATPAYGKEAEIDSSSVPLAAPSPVAPQPSAAAPKKEPAISAVPVKRKPVTLTPKKSRMPLIVIAGGVVVVVIAAAGWFFFFMPPAPPPSSIPPPPSSQVILPGTPETAGQPGAAPAGSGGLEVVPGEGSSGEAKPEAPPPPPDPATIKRKVDSLIREGRTLLDQGHWAEALSRLEQALQMDPTNFDAEELRVKAATAVAKENKFNRELESAKGAFNDGDWQGALYKLYRLREERRDRTDFQRYIKNANYNWGIEALSGFEIDGAIEHFKDALEMAPGDPAITKHLEVAQRYRRRQRDLAFEAYIKLLKPKGLEDR